MTTRQLSNHIGNCIDADTDASEIAQLVRDLGGTEDQACEIIADFGR